MSNLNYFFIYDSLNYNCEKFNDLTQFKKKFLLDNNKQFLLFDTFGKEYNQDTINVINVDENNQRAKYVIYYYNNHRNFEFEEKNAGDIMLNQIEIDNILTKYLESKKSYLIQSKEICDEILKRYEEFNEDKDRINEFVDKYGGIFEMDKECKKYIDMISNSSKEIESLAPKFKETMESDMNAMYNEVLNKIENIMKNELNGNPHVETFEEKKKIFKGNDSIIKKKLLSIINNQELIYSVQKKMNEILIYGEKINFLLNLSEIPNIYALINKESLKEEYKRRNKFNYLYEKIMHFVESDLICKEFEYRKNFIKKNFKFTNKMKIEKKTITILNKLIDFEAQQLFIKDVELFKSNYELVDNLTKSIDDLIEYLNKISEELFSKKKKEININKNKSEPRLNQDKNINNNNNYSEQFGEIKQIIRSSSLPEIKENKIISIIENKILRINNDFKNNNTLNHISSNDDLYLSNIDFNTSMNVPNPNITKIIQSFSDTYGKFLWFYEKVYNYLLIYSQRCDTKNVVLNKDDPFSINNYLIDILNENKSLKDKIRQIRNEAK